VNGSPDWLAGISLPLDVGLYHSWAVDDKTLPDSILPQAWSHQGVLMALSIPDKKSVGLQFHPESVMTPDGDTILQAWVNSLS
jgi:anthranilate synthase component 2